MTLKWQNLEKIEWRIITGLGRTKYKFSFGLSYKKSLSEHEQNKLKDAKSTIILVYFGQEEKNIFF
jgi:hypothetical protein